MPKNELDRKRLFWACTLSLFLMGGMAGDYIFLSRRHDSLREESQRKEREISRNYDELLQERNSIKKSLGSLEFSEARYSGPSTDFPKIWAWIGGSDSLPPGLGLDEICFRIQNRVEVSGRVAAPSLAKAKKYVQAYADRLTEKFPFSGKCVSSMHVESEKGETGRQKFSLALSWAP